MLNFLKKYFVFFFLGGLIIILVLLKIFYGNENTKNTINITPTITPIITKNITPTGIVGDESVDTEKYGVTVDALPYQGKKMQITRYLKPGVLEVVIKKEEDKAEAEIEIKEWMERYPTFKDQTYVFKISNF